VISDFARIVAKILSLVVFVPSDLRGILRGDLRGSGKYYLSITLFCRVKIFDVPLQQT
jgi:hypothetical protein